MTCIPMMYNIWATIIYYLCVKCSWSSVVDVLSDGLWNSLQEHLEKFLKCLVPKRSLRAADGPRVQDPRAGTLGFEYLNFTGRSNVLMDDPRTLAMRLNVDSQWVFSWTVRFSPRWSTGTCVLEAKCLCRVSVLMNCLVFSRFMCSKTSKKETHL